MSSLFQEFTVGIDIMLRKWTAFQICIQQDLAGFDSIQKHTQLLHLICNYFLTQDQRVTQQLLDESLVWFFEDMFNVALEDGSASDVARRMCGLYNDVVQRGDVTQLNVLKQTAPVNNTAYSRIDATHSDDSDDSEDDSDEEMYVVKEKIEPVIDEDGFQMVQKGQKKHNWK